LPKDGCLLRVKRGNASKSWMPCLPKSPPSWQSMKT
jgi:hypothetical protein